MGNIKSIQYLEKQNAEQTIQKINNDKYVILKTGELKEFKHTKNRSENTNSMRSTMKRLRELINTNFTGSKNELFVTLTYKNNMTDNKQLSKDFLLFLKRLKYHYKDKQIEYIRVNEPQGRMVNGKPVWHIHCLIKGLSYINNNLLREKIWMNGFVNVQSMKKIDNVGAYFTSYLTNIPLNEIDKNNFKGQFKLIEKKQKKFIKGGRLQYYPPGMNFYSSSKGIKKPESYYAIYGNLNLNKFGKLTNHYVTKIESNKFSSLIIKDDYNSRR